MQSLNCLGDNTRDFIELSHQTRQDRRTQCLRDYKHKHESQYKAEHQASHPKVQEVKGGVMEKRKLREKNMQPSKG